MLQQRINQRQRQKGMNTLDYFLLAGGATCAVLAVGDFAIRGNDFIFLAVSGLCIWFAFDGVEANWRDVAAIVILLVMGILVFANLEPYAAAAYYLFSNKLPAQILSLIPFIGGIWAYVIGGLFMSIILALEVAPTVIMGTKASIKRTIDILKATYRENPTDPNVPAEIAKLQARHDRFELEIFLLFNQARVFAYLVDFVMICLRYPPLKDGWESMRWGFPRLDDLDWSNILITFGILIGLELLIFAYLWLRNVNSIFLKEVQP